MKPAACPYICTASPASGIAAFAEVAIIAASTAEPKSVLLNIVIIPSFNLCSNAWIFKLVAEMNHALDLLSGADYDNVFSQRKYSYIF